MGYASIVSGETVKNTESSTRVNREAFADTVSVRADYRTNTTSPTVQTRIFLTNEIARAAKLRAGSRVSVLVGTGKDEGRVRIVANPKGTYKLGRGFGNQKIRISTHNLLAQPQNRESVTVTSYGKGVVTFTI